MSNIPCHGYTRDVYTSQCCRSALINKMDNRVLLGASLCGLLDRECKKTELHLGYRACQSVGICIVTFCLGTDVPAVAGSRSVCILAQGMRRSYVLVLHPCPRDASRSGLAKQVGGEDRTQAPSASGLVWSGAQGCFGTPSDTKL